MVCPSLQDSLFRLLVFPLELLYGLITKPSDLRLFVMMTDAGLGASYSLLLSTDSYQLGRQKELVAKWGPVPPGSPTHTLSVLSVEEQNLDPKPHGTPP